MTPPKRASEGRHTRKRPFQVKKTNRKKNHRPKKLRPRPANETDDPGLVQNKSIKSNFGRHRDDHSHNHDDRIGDFPGEITSVPNPVPDTGFLPTPMQASSDYLVALTTSPLPVSPSASPISRTSPHHVSFSALPALTSPHLSADPVSLSTSMSAFTPSSMPTAGPIAGGLSGQSSLDETLNVASSPSHSRPHTLSTSMISVISVVSFIILAAVTTLLLKYCTPSRRRRLPKPSLPILDDSFSDDKSDSPIFGGKERLSSRPGSTGLWAWTPYRAISSEPDKPHTTTTQAPTDGHDSTSEYWAVSRSPRLQSPLQNMQSASFRFPKHSHTHSAPTHVQTNESDYQPSMHQVRSALSRATSCISAASMSLYTSSPRPSDDQVGIAIGSASPGTVYTADGQDLLKRLDSRRSLERCRSGPNTSERKTKRYSTSSQWAAYDGADIDSPTFPSYAGAGPNTVAGQTATTYLATRGGRTRIKSSSYYVPGSYPRASHLSPLSSSLGTNKRGAHERRGPQFSSSHLDSCQKFLDPQGLACCPGMASLSNAQIAAGNCVSENATKGGTNWKPTILEKKPENINAFVDASAAAPENLSDMADVKMNESKPPSLPRRLSVNKPVMPTIRIEAPKETRKAPATTRPDDRPPYIPLPAPLPSLAQMAMEHADPQLYGDYRSPTYSIYGLYEYERRKDLT